jgi:hypothetical protein
MTQVRGSTTHYDAVVGAATSGCLNAGVDTGEAGHGAVAAWQLLFVFRQCLLKIASSKEPGTVCVAVASCLNEAGNLLAGAHVRLYSLAAEFLL